MKQHLVSIFTKEVVLPTLDDLPTASSCFQNLTILIIDGCDHLKYLFSSSMVKSLVQLENLAIYKCNFIEEIIVEEDEKVNNMLFPKLKELNLFHLQRITRFCNSTGDFVELSSLLELWIVNCPRMKTLISDSICGNMTSSKQLEEINVKENFHTHMIQPLFDKKVRLPSLETLGISRMDELGKIWDHQLSVESFSKLKALGVAFCDKLVNIFPSNMFGIHQKLKELFVENCDSVEEVFQVVEKSCCIEEEAVPRFIFSELTVLRLMMLQSLKGLYPGTHISEWPMLKQLNVYGCDKVEIFASEFLSFRGTHGKSQDEITVQQPLFSIDKVVLSTDHSQLPAASSYFENLIILIIHGCDHLQYLFSSSLVKLLVQLKELEICNCNFIEEIIIEEEEKISNKLFPKLKALNLFDLQRLTRFCNSTGDFVELSSLSDLWIKNCQSMKTFISNSIYGDMTSSTQTEEIRPEENFLTHMIQPLFDKKVRLPSLEILCISHMDELEKIWDDQLSLDSFCKLKNLDVQFCNKLVNIFPYNMFGMHQKLENFYVENCDLVEEIFQVVEKNCCEGIAKEEAVPRFVFSELTRLSLKMLPSLKGLYPGTHISEWPILKQLQVYECDKVEILASQFLSIQGIYGESQDEITVQQPLFSVDKVVLSIEHSQLPAASSYFENLTILIIYGCDHLKYLFSSSVAKSFTLLEVLEICKCKFIEEIIVEDERISNKLFPKLKKLHFFKLQRLLRFCNSKGDFVELCLFELWIKNCPSIKTFISNSICGDMKSSNELEELNSNYMIQPLFDKTVRLTSLKILRIEYMDRLRKIWDNQLTVDSLGELKWFFVAYCSKLVNIFSSNMLGILQKLDTLIIENCDSLEDIFEGFEKSSPMVEETVSKEEAVPRFVFSELTSLHLKMLPSLKSLYPGTHISEWTALKELKVHKCDKVEIFASEFLSFQESHGHTESQHKIPIHPLFLVDKDAFPSLEELELCQLPRLLHLWKENSQPSHTFQNLTTLKVSECGNLENLCSSSVSFQNLTSLQVSKCDGLRHLLTLSKAKTLLQLTSVNISDCKMMEKTITHTGDEVKDSVCFSKLYWLELHCLPSLRTFCVGDYTLEFPSLEKVIVRECLKMETFCHGVLSTPKIQNLQLIEGQDEVEECWEGDLNSAIQHLFEKWHVQSSKED